ncbi:unnamed protein product [Macrosiphum euphorbiae]|nr:unnamed protein product [Macrosiphum euphorbiae]
MATPRTASMVRDWSVTDETDSDHNVLSFYVDLRTDRLPRVVSHRYNTKRADWAKFASCLCNQRAIIDRSNVDTYARTLVCAIQIAAAGSMPKAGAADRRPGKQSWWTVELTYAKKAMDRMRRLGLQRTDRPSYNQARNSYVAHI